MRPLGYIFPICYTLERNVSGTFRSTSKVINDLLKLINKGKININQNNSFMDETIPTQTIDTFRK